MARIILADDDAAMRDLLRHALETDGHMLNVFSDGGEALAAYGDQHEEIDLVITDIDMPVLDGIGFARKIVETAPDTPIIMMSALDAELERAAAIGGARVEVMSKPFTLEEFRAVVAKMLNG